MAELPPARWYPDPDDPTRLRWWDGARWTEDRSAAPSTTSAPPSAPSRGGRAAVPVVLVVVGLLVLLAGIGVLVAAGSLTGQGSGGGSGGPPPDAGPRDIAVGDGIVVHVNPNTVGTHASIASFSEFTTGPDTRCGFKVVDDFGHVQAAITEGLVACDWTRDQAQGIPQTSENQALVDALVKVMTEDLGWRQDGYGAQGVWWNVAFARSG